MAEKPYLGGRTVFIFPTTLAVTNFLSYDNRISTSIVFKEIFGTYLRLILVVEVKFLEKEGR